MYIVTAEEMREIDRNAIEEIGIPSAVLMENAGSLVAKVILEKIKDNKNKKVIILAGHGNNGGDGFVVSRHLNEADIDVEVWVIGDIKKCSPESKIFLDVLHNSRYLVKYWAKNNQEEMFKSLRNANVIVDAMLGIGCIGELRTPFKEIIEYINSLDAFKIAVDIPTGVDTNSGAIEQIAFKANTTVTFGLPKLGQLLYPGAEYVGELIINKITIPEKAIEKANPNKYLILGKELSQEFLPVKTANAHKGIYGHALIIGGSKSMPGAPALATRASLRIGTGLTTVAVPESIQSMVFGYTPEAICMGLPELSSGNLSIESYELLFGNNKKYDALGVGPGIGIWDEGFDLIKKILGNFNNPVILDADGLNIISRDLSILKNRKFPTIVTPHPGEMSRLIKKEINYVQNNRVSVAKEFAEYYGVYVVLKGAHTIIATPSGEIHINITGGPELAKGGTGDVLTGIITGLISQKLSIKKAVIIGVYLHGLAGSLASFPSDYSTLSTEVIEKIGLAIKQTMSNHA